MTDHAAFLAYWEARNRRAALNREPELNYIDALDEWASLDDAGKEPFRLETAEKAS
jgi:hypothetical protein